MKSEVRYAMSSLNEIQLLRHQTGLSQSQFARKYSIPVRSLQQWEQSKSKPPHYVVELLKTCINDTDTWKTSLERSPRHYIQPKNSWRVCIENPFKNCEKIYPLQQRKIAELIDDLSQDPRVSKIIVFGSSVTDKCHIGSDVDIFVERNHAADNTNPSAVHFPSRAYDFEYDYWTDETVDDRLLSEINSKGVIVYEREKRELIFPSTRIRNGETAASFYCSCERFFQRAYNTV